MNLVLVGLPGCGKSTVGQAVAKRLQLPFFDSDIIIAERSGKSIPEIFAREGESGFRRRESLCLCALLQKDEAVIATGGGAVLMEENRRAMKTAQVIFLDRSCNDIMSTAKTEGRPLMESHSLQELSDMRRHLYLEAANGIVNEKTAEAAAEAVIKWWEARK